MPEGRQKKGRAKAREEGRREAILCPWLMTETMQSAARPPVWCSGIAALLSLIYQTKAFSALQHRAFTDHVGILRGNDGWIPPALEDSAIQAGSQTAALGFAPGNALLFVFYFELGPHFTLITHVSFLVFLLFDLFLTVLLDFRALLIRLLCCSVTSSPERVGNERLCPAYMRSVVTV